MHPKLNIQIVFLLILLIGFKPAIGQYSTIWFEDSATWHYGYGEGMGSRSAGFEKLVVSGDTSINSTNYKIISRTRFYSNQSIQELDNLYFRYDPEYDQVYRFIDSTEYLLYDFSAEKGDTIVVNAFDWNNQISYCRLVVDSITVELFSDSIERRVQYCEQIDNFDYYFSGMMIEGIGSEMFLFPVDQLMCDAGCADDLRCFQDSKITIANPNIGCEELVTDLEFSETALAEITIYPNPTSGKLFMEYLDPNDFLRLDLFDQDGKVCFSTKDIVEIDLKSMTDGIYFVKITLADQSVIVKKIIKINER